MHDEQFVTLAVGRICFIGKLWEMFLEIAGFPLVGISIKEPHIKSDRYRVER